MELEGRGNYLPFLRVLLVVRIRLIPYIRFYMEGDPYFYLYLSLFVGSMVTLILGERLWVIFIG